MLFASGCTKEDAKTEFFVETQTLQDTMHFLLEPAADVIWDSAGWIITEDETIDLVPTTDAGWFKVAHNGVTIMESGNLLLMPSLRHDDEDWAEISRGLVAVGASIKQSALDQNGERLFQLGGQLYNVCVACHQNYWIDSPVRPSDQ